MPDFIEQEGSGGKLIGERVVKLGDAKSPVSAYTRTYETTKLEDLHYRVVLAGSAVGNWAVQTTVEYASPRDDEVERGFLNTIYANATAQIGRPQAPSVPTPP